MIKTKSTLLMIATLFGFNAYAQDEEAVDKGQVIIDAYIGGPQIFSLIPKQTNTNGTEQKITKGGFGPFGARVEYMFSHKSSIGLESNFATTDLGIYWNDGQDPYQADFKANRFRIFPRYALHFGGRKLDAYFHVGLGITVWNVELNVKDPSGTFSEENVRGLNRGTGIVPAFRTGIGLRYFFTPNIGINGDFGLGGALFTGGITGKF